MLREGGKSNGDDCAQWTSLDAGHLRAYRAGMIRSPAKLPKRYREIWAADRLPAGVYWLRLRADARSETRKVLHLK